LRAGAAGALSEAANVAYYLWGGFTAAARAAALDTAFDQLAGWSRLPAVRDALGLSGDADRGLGHLAARAQPVEDPAWAAASAPPRRAGAPPLVVLSLVNGLGNQIFQYAAALRRARRAGAVLKLDLSAFAVAQLDNRAFGLGDFAIEAPLAETAEIVRAAANTHGESITALDRALLDGRDGGDTRLVGCWASPIYFRGVETELRQHLRLRDPAIAARAAAAVSALRGGAGTVIGMHVRRGDYLRPEYRNTYAPHPAAYYRAALQRLPADAAVLMFSDTPADRDWCAENFADLGARLEISRERSDIEDFALLAACDHQILSVSSFGWWAAWLNPNPAKRIVAPHPALGLGPRLAHVQLAGRVPGDWTMLRRDDLAD
jgi:hypothetical protein